MLEQGEVCFDRGNQNNTEDQTEQEITKTFDALASICDPPVWVAFIYGDRKYTQQLFLYVCIIFRDVSGHMVTLERSRYPTAYNQ